MEQINFGEHMPGEPLDPGDPVRMRERPPAQASGTILLIEDNEDNRAVYTTILRYYGYDVIEAPAAEEGMELARRIHPALILMDIGLPGIDGWEATRRLKRDPETRSIPIIALTAHALAEHRTESFAAGCDGYLAKPIEPRDVLAEVKRYLVSGAQLANRHA